MVPDVCEGPPAVTLCPWLVILSETKDPSISLRVNSAKHLCGSCVNCRDSSPRPDPVGAPLRMTGCGARGSNGGFNFGGHSDRQRRARQTAATPSMANVKPQTANGCGAFEWQIQDHR